MSDDIQAKQIQYYVRCECCGYGFEHAELDEQNVCASCRNGIQGDDEDDTSWEDTSIKYGKVYG